MKAKYLRYACILIGILLLGAIAFVVLVAMLWGKGGIGAQLFAMCYAVVAVVAIPATVTFLILSIRKGEPHRWLAVCLLILSLPVAWRGAGLLIEFGEGLARNFFAAQDRQKERNRAPPATPATAPQTPQAPSGEPLKIHLHPVQRAVVSQPPSTADAHKARADERKR
jgi:hypothetical protein